MMTHLVLSPSLPKETKRGRWLETRAQDLIHLLSETDRPLVSLFLPFKHLKDNYILEMP